MSVTGVQRTLREPCIDCKGAGSLTVFNGAHLRALREWYGLSLRFVASASGLSPAYVSDIETGKRRGEQAFGRIERVIHANKHGKSVL